jgi:hypothetical protein
VLSVKRRIMLDPNYRNYTDCALTPMQDDDELTLDLLTKTSGAKAAIDHLKKVHDLTHAKPAVAAEVSRQPAAASRTVGGARAQQPLQLAACLQILKTPERGDRLLTNQVAGAALAICR